jgi:putative transposase
VEQEAGVPTAEVCRKHGVSSATFYKWKAKFGGLDVSDAKRLRSLEDENGRLKRMLADAMLDNAALKDLLGKSGDARRATGGGGVSASDLRDERASGVPGDWDRQNQRALSGCATAG